MCRCMSVAVDANGRDAQNSRHRQVIDTARGSPGWTTRGAGRFSESGGAVHGSTQIAWGSLS